MHRGNRLTAVCSLLALAAIILVGRAGGAAAPPYDLELGGVIAGGLASSTGGTLSGGSYQPAVITHGFDMGSGYWQWVTSGLRGGTPALVSGRITALGPTGVPTSVLMFGGAKATQLVVPALDKSSATTGIFQTTFSVGSSKTSTLAETPVLPARRAWTTNAFQIKFSALGTTPSAITRVEPLTIVIGASSGPTLSVVLPSTAVSPFIAWADAVKNAADPSNPPTQDVDIDLLSPAQTSYLHITLFRVAPIAIKAVNTTTVRVELSTTSVSIAAS